MSTQTHREPKYTPGPWRSDYPVVYAASGAELLHIDEYDCTTVHDARLIAAAPELLELLAKMVVALDSKRAANEAGEPGFEFNDALWSALEPARAVIANALGP